MGTQSESHHLSNSSKKHRDRIVSVGGVDLVSTEESGGWYPADPSGEKLIMQDREGYNFLEKMRSEIQSTNGRVGL